MMILRRLVLSLQQLLLVAIVLGTAVVSVQSLSATTPISKTKTTPLRAASSTTIHGTLNQQERRRQESRNVGRQALLSLNLNLDALAKGQQGDQAQALFQRIAALHQEGYYEVSPDTVSFNSVLKAYRNDPVRALEFWESNANTTPKNIRSFNTFLLSLANAGLAQDAFNLLSQMQVVNAAVRPDLISWNTVLLAYANAHDPESAETLIQTMIKNNNHHHETIQPPKEIAASTGEDNGSNGPRPSTTPTTDSPRYTPPYPNEISIATVMMAWSRHDDALMGAKRAEEWLYRHEKVLLNKLPSPHAYTMVLQAYGRCSEQNASLVEDKVWEILQYMEDSDAAAATHNVVYHIAMSILSNLNTTTTTGTPATPPRSGMEAAKQVFKRMAQPDVPSYTRMIQLWGSHAKELHDKDHRHDTVKLNHCLMEILVLFRRMKKDPKVSPNSITYVVTLNAIAETQLSNSGDIAIAVLRKIKNPLLEHYNAALKAVAHSNNPTKVVQAAELLQEMITTNNLHPDHNSYHLILKAAQTGYGPMSTRSRNLQIGWDAFQTIHQLPDIPVSSITYQRCLRMIDTQDRKRRFATTMAREVLEKCCTNGCLNRHVLASARMLFAPKKKELADILGVPKLPDNDSVVGFPKEWSQHALI